MTDPTPPYDQSAAGAPDQSSPDQSSPDQSAAGAPDISLIAQLAGVQVSFADSGFSLGPIDFRAAGGETIAILGCNGAGKSTLFQLMTGNLEPHKGKVYLKGEPFTIERYELKKAIGYLPQNLPFPPWVTGGEILAYQAGLTGISEAIVAEQIATWQMADYIGSPCAGYSHGMSKRVGLALALMTNPELLILDEPFSGLDITQTHKLLDIIERRQCAQQATLVSTHILPYAAKTCTRAVYIAAGTIAEDAAWAGVAPAERERRASAFFFP